jgi:hypothetical protein
MDATMPPVISAALAARSAILSVIQKPKVVNVRRRRLVPSWALTSPDEGTKNKDCRYPLDSTAL